MSAPSPEPVAYRVKLATLESGMAHAYAENARLLAYMQEYSYWRSTEEQDFTPQDCADAIRALMEKSS